MGALTRLPAFAAFANAPSFDVGHAEAAAARLQRVAKHLMRVRRCQDSYTPDQAAAELTLRLTLVTAAADLAIFIGASARFDPAGERWAPYVNLFAVAASGAIYAGATCKEFCEACPVKVWYAAYCAAQADRGWYLPRVLGPYGVLAVARDGGLAQPPAEGALAHYGAHLWAADPLRHADPLAFIDFFFLLSPLGRGFLGALLADGGRCPSARLADAELEHSDDLPPVSGRALEACWGAFAHMSAECVVTSLPAALAAALCHGRRVARAASPNVLGWGGRPAETLLDDVLGALEAAIAPGVRAGLAASALALAGSRVKYEWLADRVRSWAAEK